MAHEYVYWNPDQSRKGAGNVQAADHVCRPVIVDSQGRKRPIVCFTPVSNTNTRETRVTTIETVIESLHPPAGTGAGAGAGAELLTKFIQTETTPAPVRPGPLTAMNWRQPRNSSSIAGGGGGGDYWNKPNGDQAVIGSGGYDDGKHVPVSAGPKHTEIIDSKEAAKRYGSFSGSPTGRPYSSSWGMVIDSKTAEEKYKGANVR